MLGHFFSAVEVSENLVLISKFVYLSVDIFVVVINFPYIIVWSPFLGG